MNVADVLLFTNRKDQVGVVLVFCVLLARSLYLNTLGVNPAAGHY